VVSLASDIGVPTAELVVPVMLFAPLNAVYDCVDYSRIQEDVVKG
jgi:hypothetical protein